jgi:hypothetical protein
MKPPDAGYLMKKSIFPLGLFCLAGCVGLMDSPAVPMNMPVAKGVIEIHVTAHGGKESLFAIKDRQQIESIMYALEGERKDWYRPQKFPTEEFALTFVSRGGRTRTLLLGDGWFGGQCGETRILRRLSAKEEKEIRVLLGVDVPLPE